MKEAFFETPTRQRSYRVLKGATREFYVCTTAGPRDWRTALCVFDSEARAGEYLRSLGGPRAFVEALRRYGVQVPDWMLREPQLPETHEVTVPELCRVAEGIGVEWVAANPPPVEPHPDSQRTGVLPLLAVEDLDMSPYYHTGLPDTTVQLGKEETN